MHTGGVQIEFDPAKARANLAKNRIGFAHAEQALRDPFAVTIEDPDATGERRFVTLGMIWMRSGVSSWLFTLRVEMLFD